MPDFIITRGLPASGKSTFARQWVSQEDSRVELNRDNMRTALGFPSKGNRFQESTVTSALDAALSACLTEGKDIIVSDTNLRDKFLKVLIGKALAAGYDVEVKDFPVEVDELIERDARREASVGEKVIADFNRRFPYSRWTSGEVLIDKARATLAATQFLPIDNDSSLDKAVVFDIDGTLALMNGRSPYDFSKVGEDTLNESVYAALMAHYNDGATIVIMSGRSDECKPETLEWLDTHSIPYASLNMRREGDYRKDDIVKYEMIKEHIEGKYHVSAWYDDRNQVVSMVRKVIPGACFQVEYGDF